MLLAIPLTVCLAVIGKHVPQLEFLYILLGDNKALEAHEECYHRLLTEGQNESLALVEKYLKENSLISLYDTVLIPLIIKIETDLTVENLDPEKAEFLYQNIRDIIEDLNGMPLPISSELSAEKSQNIHYSQANCHILCVPARALRDEMAAQMLTQLLQQQSFNAENISAEIKSGQILDLVTQHDMNAIFILAVYPSTLLHARFLCKKLRSQKITSNIIVCLLGMEKADEEVKEKLLSVGADAVVTSLKDSLLQLENLAS